MFRWRSRKATTRIILHDSHTGPEVATVEDYLRAYGRTIGLLDVGYHIIIERSGCAAFCRPLWAVGSHTPGHNQDSVGICMAGGEHAPLNDAQILRLKDVVEALHNKYGPIPLIGHTEIQKYRKRDLKCPAADMEAVRRLIGDA